MHAFGSPSDFFGKKRKRYFLALDDAFLVGPPILITLQLRVVRNTAASSSQLSAKPSVLQIGSTGAYRHFQRFALEAPVPQSLKHKGGACQYFSGISDFGWKSDPFSFFTLFHLPKLAFGSHRARAVTPLPVRLVTR